MKNTISAGAALNRALIAAVVSSAALAVTSLPVAAEAGSGSETAAGATVSVWDIDTSGRPPFKRRRIEVPVADVASFEMEPVETVTKWKADYSGKPPYRRSYQELPVVDSQGEMASDSGSGDVVPRPFYKRRHR